MLRLICSFVVCIWPKQVLLWYGSIILLTLKLLLDHFLSRHSFILVNLKIFAYTVKQHILVKTVLVLSESKTYTVKQHILVKRRWFCLKVFTLFCNDINLLWLKARKFYWVQHTLLQYFMIYICIIISFWAIIDIYDYFGKKKSLTLFQYHCNIDQDKKPIPNNTPQPFQAGHDKCWRVL